jgi:hypothetical protein
MHLTLQTIAFKQILQSISVDKNEQTELFNNFSKLIQARFVNVIINYLDSVNFSRAHIEVLHILQNQIQNRYFGHYKPYDYREENKILKWNSAFWGNAEPGNIEKER